MNIEHASIATATLLTQLMLRLQRDGVLSAEAVDEIMRQSIALNAEEADRPANLDAARFLKQVWEALRDDRS